MLLSKSKKFLLTFCIYGSSNNSLVFTERSFLVRYILLCTTTWSRLTYFFACNAKSFAIVSLFFFFFSSFLALLLDGLAKAFCQYLIFRYSRHVWPVPGLFPCTHWQIFHWWSVHGYSKCVWPMTCDKLQRKISDGGIKWEYEYFSV